MNNSKSLLWERRRDIRTLGIPGQILLSLAIIAFSAVCAFAPGLLGLFFTGISGAFFAYLFCCAKGPFHWMTIPVSYLIAFFIMGDPLLSLCVLLYVPIGGVLAYCVYTNRNLSVTATALTVISLLSMAVFLTITVTRIYGEGIKGSYIALYDEFVSIFNETFSLISYPGIDGKIYSIPRETIDALLHQTVLVIPCVCVLHCELIAYIGAKIFRLFTIIFKNNALFAERRWAVTLSAPAGAILLVSLVISMCSLKASVIAYAAVNLAYILIPPAAIAGFHGIFGKNGVFKRTPKGFHRTFILASCIFIGVLSPFYLVQMLAVFACISSLGRAVIAIARDRMNNNGKL